MIRLMLLASSLLASAGCAHRGPLPVLVAPAAVTREDALPELPGSSLVIPLSVPVAALTQLVQERLSIPSAPDWLQVTSEGDSPEVGIRYHAELGELQLQPEGPVVHTTLLIRYFGSFRARAKLPFGWTWLTKNTAWGSRERPGTIAIRVGTRLTLAPDWQLRAESVLEDVVLTAPDVDKLCAGKVFRVCVPIEVARGQVHAELERQVRARAADGLHELDAQLMQHADLQSLAQRVWQRLQEPREAADGTRLSLSPETMTLSHPRVQADQLVIDLSVQGRPRWSAEAQVQPRALPAAAEPSAASNALHVTLALARTTLSERLTAALASEPNDAGYRVTALRLLGPALTPARWLLSVTLASDARSGELYVEAGLEPHGATLHLTAVQPLPGAQPLLDATDFDAAQLANALARPADLSPDLARPLAEVRALLAASVSPWPVSPLVGVTARLESVYAARDGVVLTAVAR
ncbi:MAG TPA: DUF4403 family protein [Polyangiales bacterium]